MNHLKSFGIVTNIRDGWHRIAGATYGHGMPCPYVCLGSSCTYKRKRRHDETGAPEIVIGIGSSLRRNRRCDLRCRRSAGYLAHLEADKSPHGDILAELGNRLCDHLADRHRLVLDVVLLVEAILLIELLHLSGDNALDNRLGLAGGLCLILVDLALTLEHLGRDFFAAQIARIDRGDVHRHVVAKLLESFRARDEVRLAVDFDDHADFATSMDVVADETFRRLALRLLGGRRLSLLAKDVDRLLDVGARLHERGAAIRETGSGPFAQFFHEVRWYLHGLRLCTHPFLLLFHCCDEINFCEMRLSGEGPTELRTVAKRPGAPCKRERRAC